MDSNNKIAQLIADNPRLNTTYPVLFRKDANAVADYVNQLLPEDLQAVAIDFRECGFSGG